MHQNVGSNGPKCKFYFKHTFILLSIHLTTMPKLDQNDALFCNLNNYWYTFYYDTDVLLLSKFEPRLFKNPVKEWCETLATSGTLKKNSVVDFWTSLTSKEIQYQK